MTLTVSNNIRITDPGEKILDWCNRNLVFDNPDYTTRARMGFYTGKTPPKIRLYEKLGNEILLPYGVLRRAMRIIPPETELKGDYLPIQTVDYGGTDVPLYDYQKSAVDAMYAAKYGVLVSPAGSGKTQAGIALIKRYRRRALWLTHTGDLLRQSLDRAKEYINPALIGTITEGKVNASAGVTFATVQTMSKLDLPQFKNFWDVVIVDECHRVASNATNTAMFYKVLNNLAARHKFGLTATAHRADGMMPAVYAIIGDVVHTTPDSEVKDKIMPVAVKPVYTFTPLDTEFLNTDGTLNYTKMITLLAENMTRNNIILDNLSRERDHYVLILSDRISHLTYLMSALPENMRDNAVLITGNTKPGDRERALDEMRGGSKRYLFATYSLAKEGLNIPRLDRLFLTTPKKDYAVVAQSIGRIARADAGKEQPVALDFVDNFGAAANMFRQRKRHYAAVHAFIMEGDRP